MTASIPAEVRRLAEARVVGRFKREHIGSAQAAMSKLGIPSSSELFAFCSEYCLGNLLSEQSDETLVDVSEPSEEMASGTKFAHEVWELPSEYVCLTSCQGEGGYLYSKATEEVFDFSLESREEFLCGPQARWGSFYEFMHWYLSARGDASKSGTASVGRIINAPYFQ